MTDAALRRTPLFERHQQLGGKLVPFAGWELPVQYRGVVPEHHAVRNAVGIFDVSHMGEIEVRGSQAEQALNYLTCNDVTTLVDGKAHYSAILTPQGGVVDDIIIYRFSREHYLLCVNAANTARDFEWLTEHNRFDAQFENVSDRYGQIALQGPQARAVLQALGAQGAALAQLKYFHFVESELFGVPVLVACTGYTGEDGVELFIPWDQTGQVWDGLLASSEATVEPCGLGARDSLRLEACYPLHGHELSQEVSAIESGLGWVVKLKKGDFIGREALEPQVREGAPRAVAAFFVEDAGITRHGDPVHDDAGRVVGVVTSGTKTPTLNRALGLALVERRFAEVGSTFFAQVRGKGLRCSVVPKPFYKRS